MIDGIHLMSGRCQSLPIHDMDHPLTKIGFICTKIGRSQPFYPGKV